MWVNFFSRYLSLLKLCGISVLRCDEVGHTFFCADCFGNMTEKNSEHTTRKKKVTDKKRQIIAFEHKARQKVGLRLLWCWCWPEESVGEWTCSRIDTIYLEHGCTLSVHNMSCLQWDFFFVRKISLRSLSPSFHFFSIEWFIKRNAPPIALTVFIQINVRFFIY